MTSNTINVADIAGTIISGALFIVIAGAAISLIVGIVMVARGDSRGKTVALLAIIAMCLASVADSVVSGIYSPSGEYGWIYYLIIAALFVAALAYLAAGKVEESLWHVVAIFLVLFAISISTSLSGGINLTGSSSSCVLTVTANPSYGVPPLETTVTVNVQGDASSVLIDFGDGSTATVSANGQVTHTYQNPGTYGIAAVATGNGVKCMSGTGVTVANMPPIPLVGGVVNTFSQWIGPYLSFLNMPISWVYSTPLFEMKPDSTDYKYYTYITYVALGAFGLYFALRIIGGFMSGGSMSAEAINAFKDSIVVLIAIPITPVLYNVAASICNNISNYVVEDINLAGIYGIIAGMIGLGVIFSWLSSYAGNLAAILTMSVIIANAMCIMRFFIIKALVAIAPLLAVSYLHPAFRGVVKFFVGLLTGLMLAGPLAAIMLALFSAYIQSVPVVGMILYAFASPIILALVPMTLGLGATGNFAMGGISLARIGMGTIIGPSLLSSGSQAPTGDMGSSSTFMGFSGVGGESFAHGMASMGSISPMSFNQRPNTPPGMYARLNNANNYPAPWTPVPTPSPSPTPTPTPTPSSHQGEAQGAPTVGGPEFGLPVAPARSYTETEDISPLEPASTSPLPTVSPPLRERIANAARTLREHMLYQYHVMTGSVHPAVVGRYTKPPKQDYILIYESGEEEFEDSTWEDSDTTTVSGQN